MVSLIVFIVVLGLVYWLVSLIPAPAPFPMIIKVLFTILAVIAVLQFFGVHTGLPRLRN